MSVQIPSPVKRRREYLQKPVIRNPDEDALSRIIGGPKSMSLLLSSGKRSTTPDSGLSSLAYRLGYELIGGTHLVAVATPSDSVSESIKIVTKTT